MRGEIVEGPEFYEKVSATVREKGVMGSKGFFYAIYEEDRGLMINLEHIQPPEPW